MAKDVIIACDFASRRQTLDFLDAFEGRRKPFHTELTKLQKTVMNTFGISGEFDIDLPESADDDEIKTYSEN